MSSRNMQRMHREGSGGISLFMLIVGTRGALVFNATTPPLYPRKRAPVPMVHDLGGPKGPSGLVWRRENLLVPPEFKPRNFQSAASPCIDYAVLARSSIIGPVSIIDIYSHLNKWLPILQTFLRSSNLMRRSVNSDLYWGWWLGTLFGTYCRWIIFWSRWIQSTFSHSFAINSF